MKINIFYSWQSSTNETYNKRFIRKCIDKAVIEINRSNQFQGIDINVTDATRGESGSPEVASTIIDNKIPNCDIFIADLSVVNYLEEDIIDLIKSKWPTYKHKFYQNNNVLHEYGVAIPIISRKRIIGILNNAYGSPFEDENTIPFDIKHVRFPIEYNYTQNTTKEELEKSKKRVNFNIERSFD